LVPDDDVGRVTMTVVVLEMVVDVRRVVTMTPPSVGTETPPVGRRLPSVLVGWSEGTSDSDSVTGQTVVLIAMTEVTVRAGQSVTVTGHEVMVEVRVV
jgi:hypothetical protein